jgi:hypothetical protein
MLLAPKNKCHTLANLLIARLYYKQLLTLSAASSKIGMSMFENRHQSAEKLITTNSFEAEMKKFRGISES